MIRTLSFEDALRRLSHRNRIVGFDRNKTNATMGYGYESTEDALNAFDGNPSAPTRLCISVNHQSHDDSVFIDSPLESQNALMSMGFVVDGSRWFEERPGRPTSDKPGYVYLVRLQGTSYYKIGISVKPNERLKSFSVEFPIEAKPVAVWHVRDMYSTEQMLHEMCFAYHKNGEWFEFNSDAVLWLIGLMKNISERVH